VVVGWGVIVLPPPTIFIVYVKFECTAYVTKRTGDTRLTNDVPAAWTIPLPQISFKIFDTLKIRDQPNSIFGLNFADLSTNSIETGLNLQLRPSQICQISLNFETLILILLFILLLLNY
jgi:hypothetical protein